MSVCYNPRTVTDGLILALDAGNTKSYPGSGTTWTDLSLTRVESSSAPNTGYFGGGRDFTDYWSTLDKVDYSTDTTAAVPGANLTIARDNLAATGNSIAGYFGGGFGPRSTMDKVTYSNDTVSAVPGANLTTNSSNMGATGNSTAGYFGGGNRPSSGSTRMDKVTYSSDTTAAVPGANLSVASSGLTATGNSTAGYFGGGIDNLPSLRVTTMDKVTYSSDTRSTVPGASLSQERAYFAATGNSTSGYFGGGRFPSPSGYSIMDKVTYSTDTTAAVPGAFLVVTRSAHSATGNSTAGYFGGGDNPSPGFLTQVDKVTYSTDTTALVPGAFLTAARYGAAASSARANALPVTSTIVRNSGALINNPTYSTTNGGSILFDGTNNYMSANISCSRTFYSIDWWARPTSVSNYNQVIMMNSSGTAGNYWQGFTTHTDSSGTLYIGTTTGSRATAGGIYTNGSWINLTWTFNNGVGTLYRNGSLVGSVSLAVHSADFTLLQIGAGPTFGENTLFNGNCALLRLYSNKVLTAQEVRQNFNALRGRFGI